MGAQTIQEWGPFVAETVKMIGRADRDAILLAAALTDEEWTSSLLKHAGNGLNMVSIHGYWDALHAEDHPSAYADCMMRTNEPEASILATESIIEKAGFKGRMGIAFDEWNLRGWHHPRQDSGFTDEEIKARDRNDINASYTMADAIFSACFLNACMRHADTVKMANIAPLVNTRGPLYVHPKGIVKRTTFHTLAMYANLLGPQVGKAIVTSEPFNSGERSVAAVDAIATCDISQKNWRIVLVNCHPSAAVSCTFTLSGKPVNGKLHATVLAGDSTDAYNDVGHPDRVTPQELELEFVDGVCKLSPHSITVVNIN